MIDINKFKPNNEVLYRTSKKHKWHYARINTIIKETQEIRLLYCTPDEYKIMKNNNDFSNATFWLEAITDTFEMVEFHPNVTGYLENTRRDTYEESAKKWIEKNKVKYGDLVEIYVPNRLALEPFDSTRVWPIEKSKKYKNRVFVVNRVNPDGTLNLYSLKYGQGYPTMFLKEVPYTTVHKLFYNNKIHRRTILAYEALTGYVHPEKKQEEKEINEKSLKSINNIETNQSILSDKHVENKHYVNGAIIDFMDRSVSVLKNESCKIEIKKNTGDIIVKVGNSRGVLHISNKKCIEDNTIVLVRNDNSDWVLGVLDHKVWNDNRNDYDYYLKGGPIYSYNYCIRYKGNEDKLKDTIM